MSNMNPGQLTVVTAPDYYLDPSARIVVIGCEQFIADIKTQIYEVWPEQPVTLFTTDDVHANLEWLFNVLQSAHFLILELNFSYIPVWLVEWYSDIPRVYYEAGMTNKSINLATKNRKLVAHSIDEVVAAAIKELA